MTQSARSHVLVPYSAVDPTKLHVRLRHYCKLHYVDQDIMDNMVNLLQSDTALQLLAMPEDVWRGSLVNDAYKVKMHRMYAEWMTGVKADFALNVRKTAISLDKIRDEHADLYGQFRNEADHLSQLEPYSKEVAAALKVFFNFTVTEVECGMLIIL